MKFLVAGCGSIGRRHLGNLKSLGVTDLTALDILPERRREAEKDFNVPAFESLSEALADGPNVVFVTAPTSLHVSVALEAAQRGCHLFVEKPLSHNLDDVDRLLSLAKAKGLVTLVGCNMRFHPGIAKVKKLLAEGTIGTIVSARAQTGQWLPDWHPWEEYRVGYSANQNLGGGIILDAIHEIDYIQWMVGEPVDDVACFAGHLSRLEIDTEDTAAILLRFADGTIGEIHMDYVQRSSSRSCHIIGDEGSVHWDQCNHKVRWYSASNGDWQQFDYSSEWDPNQMYLDELGHFLRCLTGQEQPAQDLDAAKGILEIGLAAKDSAEMGQIIKLGVNIH